MNIPRDFVGVNSPPNNSIWVTCLAILFLGTMFLVAVCGGDPDIEMNVTKVVTPSDLVACDDARIWINITPENEPSADIVLVIDTSFSMKDKYNNIETIDYAKGAAKTFVDLVNFSSNNVSVVSYNSIATLEQNLTNNATAILDSIDGLTIHSEVWRGGTNIGEGIRIAQQELDKSTDESIEVIVLFTDGTATFYGDDVTEANYTSRWCGNCPVSDTICSDYAKNEAQKSKDNDTTIFTVGFFGGIEGHCGNATSVFGRTLLKDIASDGTRTRYYESPTPEDLEDVYRSIYRHIYAATDLIAVEYLSPIFTVLGGCPGDRCTTFPNGTQKIEFEKDILRFDEIWNIQINITSQWAGTFGTNDARSYISYKSPYETRINKTLPIPDPINVTRPLHLENIAPESAAACTEFNYTIRLEHTGCLDVRNLTICDKLPEKVSFVSAWCNDPDLEPVYDPDTHSVSIDTIEPFKGGDVIVCDITVLPDEMASGTVLNNASVTFLRSQCIIEAINITEVINNSKISVTKTADYGEGSGNPPLAPGTRINYTITVTNTGDVDLIDVSVVDTLLSLDGPFGDDSDGRLNPAETWTYTGSHTVTGEDLCDGWINNTVTANGTDPCGNVREDEADYNILTAAFDSMLTIYKTADYGPCFEQPENRAGLGDTIHYTITISNSGNINLTKMNVTDSLIDLDGPFGDIGNDGWLNISEVWTYTGTHTVTEMDVCDSINNTVTANATDACGNTLEDEKVSYCVPTVYTSALNVTKTSDHDLSTPSPGPGTKITYTINVTNGGDVNLTYVNVTDTLIGHLIDHSGDNNNDGWLNLSEVWTYTGIYTVTENDVCRRLVDNTVTVNATDPCDNVLKAEADESIPVAGYGALLTIDKWANYGSSPDKPPGKPAGPGDTINYTITATCAAPINLTKVNVIDNLTALGGPTGDTNHDGWLNTSEVWTYTGSHTVTEKDVCRYWVNNTVTANATDPIGHVTEDETASWCVPTESRSAIEVNKTAYPESGRPSANITFLIRVTNTGELDLDQVIVVDELPIGLEYISDNRSGTVVGNRINWTFGSLAAGESTFIELIAQINGEAFGVLTNEVNVTGVLPTGENVTDEDTTDIVAIAPLSNVNYDRLSLGDQLAQSIGKGPTAKNRLSVMKRQSAS